jgi:transcriptional regulator with XRE-family HTH domain
MREELTVSEVLGKNIRSLREATGLTQAELGEAMVSLGFPWQSRQTVAEVEAGRRPPSLEELVALAAYFDMPVNTLFTGAGTALPYRSVRVGDAIVEAGTWAQITYGRSDREPPNENIAPAIDALVGRLDRPWSRLWRERGGHPAMAFMDAWRERQAGRRRWPGPIYVVTKEDEGPVAFGAVVGPWGASAPIRLEPGVPFVARNENEARALADRERQGFVRRVSRQQAYKMRKKGAQDGVDS